MSAEQTPDIETVAKVLAEHRELSRRQLPPLLVSGCKCGWGSEVFAHSAHVAQALAPVLAAAVREARAAELREAADLYRALGDDLSICAGHVTAELDYRADRIAVDAPEGGA